MSTTTELVDHLCIKCGYTERFKPYSNPSCTSHSCHGGVMVRCDVVRHVAVEMPKYVERGPDRRQKDTPTTRRTHTCTTTDGVAGSVAVPVPWRISEEGWTTHPGCDEPEEVGKVRFVQLLDSDGQLWVRVEMPEADDA